MKVKRNKSITDIVLFLLTVMFVSGMTVFGGIKPVFAAQPETVLTLDSRNDYENVPFEASNMFPGDTETNIYNVKVVYEDTVKVRFRINIHENYEKLAEVLRCKIVLKNTEETLYDGLMKDAPNAMEHTLAKTEGNEAELTYEINAYLDTSVGNEYQGKKLKAAFVWWIEGEEDLSDTDENQQPESADKTDVQTPSGQTPPTGDEARLSLWGTLALCTAVLMGIIVFKKHKSGQIGESGGNARRKVLMSVAVIMFLIAGMAVTTYALLYQAVAVDANVFQTGTVGINLNDDEPVIKPDEFVFEPGMTVVKDFFLENEGTIDVYYRLYFDNVEGNVADVLEITIKEANEVLFKGKAAEMTKDNACRSEKTLGVGEKAWLTAIFYYPEEEGNDTQKQFMSFDICADAVQVKNNPERLFE